MDCTAIETTFGDREAACGEHCCFVRAQSRQPETHPAGPIVAHSSPTYLSVT